MCCLLFFNDYQENEVRKTGIIYSETKLIDAEINYVGNRIDRLTSDSLYIRDTVQIAGVDPAGITALKKQWIAFSDSIKKYDQIRYLDLNGNELIRVKYSSDGSYAVPDNQLQNKSQRNYFTESRSLQENQIYISRLALNTEHDIIEKPLKPVIRLAIPYFDKNGVKQGVIVLNYLAKNMIDGFSQTGETSSSSTYLLNSSGYWLYNAADHHTEWAFMYPDRENISFAKQYPDEWSKIQAAHKSSFTTSNGFFVFSTVLTENNYQRENPLISPVLGEGDWFIVSQIKPDSGSPVTLSKADLVHRVIKSIAPFFILIWLFSILTVLLAQKGKLKRERVRYLSEHDEMTGAYNRHAGSTILYELCSVGEENMPFSVTFIDIDGLKAVNDKLGHKAGDKLITDTVAVINKHKRTSDDLVRLGGDEFLIICRNSNRENAELMWNRIQKGFDAINAAGKNPFQISASHGISEYIAGDTEKTLIERSDALMYEEKKKRKMQRA